MRYNRTRPQITLPPDVYDTYEFACEVYGGVGGEKYSSGVHGRQEPYCQAGYRDFLRGGSPEYGSLEYYPGDGPSLSEYGVTVGLNDEIVAAVNRRKGRKNRWARITWAEYCAEGNIVRVEDDNAVAA